MCFSLQASIITSATLITISALYVPKQLKYPTRLIAFIPLLFGIQQACEALVWKYKAIKKSAHIAHKATYGFLFFAYIFWPIWVPIAVYMAEPHTTHIRRKQLLLITMAVGIGTSIALAYHMLINPVSTCVTCAHIIYNTGVPDQWLPLLAGGYTIATIAPWFISSMRRMWLIGLLLSIGYVVSAWYYFAAFTSVWCFFAAAASAAIYMILENNNANQKHSPRRTAQL